MLGKYFHSPALDVLKTDADKINHLWTHYGQAGKDGTNPTEMERMLGVMGLQFARGADGKKYQPGLVPNPGDPQHPYQVNSDWMAEQLAQGRPILVHGSYGSADATQASGHWLIVTGVSGKPPQFTVDNPLEDAQSVWSYDDMYQFISNKPGGGEIYAIEPQPGWVP